MFLEIGVNIDEEGNLRSNFLFLKKVTRYADK
jgi:hypothetical protein